MARKKRGPEENERRAKILELLQLANASSMDDIQNLFKDTIAEFMGNGLEQNLMISWTTVRMTPRKVLGDGSEWPEEPRRTGYFYRLHGQFDWIFSCH